MPRAPSASRATPVALHDCLRAARDHRRLARLGGVIRSWCQYAPPSEALPVLVLNEIDYDQVGADAGGFVELYNAGLGPADLEGLALVFVDGAERGRVPA